MTQWTVAYVAVLSGTEDKSLTLIQQTLADTHFQAKFPSEPLEMFEIKTELGKEMVYLHSCSTLYWSISL